MRDTPLHRAAFGGHLPVVQLLIAERAEVDAADNRGWTSLHKAVVHGHVHIAQELLGVGADASLADFEGNTPRDLACRRPKRDVPVENMKALQELLSDSDQPLTKAASTPQTI
mmetsp:Transcript_25039/g.59145  ORF Transcript_25039/g.59145 Transcript_25039/m.59145 type:complete len:113 (-) Transcript_25039:54-392(-)